MKYGFGIDLGGTTVKIAYFDETGKMLEKWEIPTDTSENGIRILPDIAASVRAFLTERKIADSDILGLGIGVPGPVNAKGVVNRCINLGWDVFNIAQKLTELTGFPVKAGNDANVAALGEFWKGGGQGCDNMVFVTLGTGVPVITMDCGELNDRKVGELFYFLELCCGVSAYILDVNPFNQPGVELYKRNMFQLLGKPGYEK